MPLLDVCLLECAARINLATACLSIVMLPSSDQRRRPRRPAALPGGIPPHKRCRVPLCLLLQLIGLHAMIQHPRRYN